MKSLRHTAYGFWTAVIMGLGSAVLADELSLSGELSPPAGEAILTVKGPAALTNSPLGAVFDLAMLQDIGTTTFATTTPWTVGVQSFSGVSLHQLLEFLGASPKGLRVTAINDYQIEIPASDAVKNGPILAWSQNGTLFSLRDKGPLWLIYPFDAKQAYQTEEIHARAVWQTVQIELIP